MQDYDLMVRAAWMYYEDEMTHAEIARKLRVNRIKVTRLLKRAREQGIVEIRVIQPMPPDLDLGRKVEAAFGIKDAVIVPSNSNGSLGQAAAEILDFHLEAESIIGFGWSSTVSQLAKYLTPHYDCNCTIVDLVGSMIGKVNPYSVSGQVAETLGANLLSLAVPVMVSSSEARDTLLAEPAIEKALMLATQSQIAFVGVGEVGPTSTLVEIDFLSDEAMHRLQASGAVGEMLMRFFDADGQPIITDTNERIIGLTWQGLSNIPNVVLMAYGGHKITAIIGALRSGIPQTLITDIETATALLQQIQNER